MNDVPTLQHIAAASYLGNAKLQQMLTKLSARAREVHPKVTDKAAVALYVISVRPGISARELEAALQSSTAVIIAVLRGLSDLGFVRVSADSWRRTATLTIKGREFAATASDREMVSAVHVLARVLQDASPTQKSPQGPGAIDLNTATAAEIKAYYDVVWLEQDQQMRRRDVGAAASASTWYR